MNYLNAVEEAVKINEEMISKLAKRLGPEEQINFQIDIIKVELRTSLQPVWPEGSINKVIQLKHTILQVSRLLNEIMSGYQLLPNDVIVQFKRRIILLDNTVKEVLENQQVMEKVVAAVTRYVEGDYAQLRKLKLEGPQELSAGNIDSSRIAPRSNDSPILLIPAHQNTMKLLRSHSAYNQPVVFGGDSPPDNNQVEVMPFEPTQGYDSKAKQTSKRNNENLEHHIQLTKPSLDLLASLEPLLPSDSLTKRKGL